MIQHTRLWTATIAAAALLALPLSSVAQSTQTGSQTGQYGQSEQQTTKSPAHHLEQADKVLDRIDESTLTGSTASVVRELKQNFEQLRTAYNARSSGSTSGTGTGTSGTGTSGTGTSGTGTSGTGTSGSGSYGSMPTGDWRESFGKIQQSLDQLNVPKSSAWMPVSGTGGSTSSGSTSGTGTGTSGTGTSGSGISSASIDPSVMSDLKEFRRHIEEFYKAASTSSDR
jgi:hypothetical protein